MKTALKKRIHQYFIAWYETDPNKWISKGEIEDLAKGVGYLGDNAGRRLRELVEEGKLINRPKGKSQEYRYSNHIETNLYKTIDHHFGVREII